jgi:hypothetical protein
MSKTWSRDLCPPSVDLHGVSGFSTARFYHGQAAVVHTVLHSTAQYCTVQYRHEADRALRSKQRKWVIPLSDIVRCFVETVDHICVVLRCAAFAIGRFAQCSCKVSKPVAARLRTVRLPPFSGRWRCSAVRSTVVIGFPRCPFSGTGLLKCPKSTKIDPIVMLQGSRIEICPSLASSYPSFTWENFHAPSPDRTGKASSNPSSVPLLSEKTHT